MDREKDREKAPLPRKFKIRNMRVHSLRRVALGGLSGLLLGQVSASSSPIAHSPSLFPSSAHHALVVCHTDLGTASVAVGPTSTITRTIHERHPVVVYVTTQETVTETPASLTATVMDYETTILTSTAITVTDTFSTTSTEYDTLTVTVTMDPIAITSSTTIPFTQTSTSTIAASAGFTPILDSLVYNYGYLFSLKESHEWFLLIKNPFPDKGIE